MKQEIALILALMSLVASAEDNYWATDESLNAWCDGSKDTNLFTSMDKHFTIDGAMIKKTVNANVIASNVWELGMKSTSHLTINDAGHIYTYGYEFADALKPVDTTSAQDMDYKVDLQYNLVVPRNNLSYPEIDYLSVIKFHNPIGSESDADPTLKLQLDTSMDNDQMLSEIQKSIDQMNQDGSTPQSGLTPSELTIKFIAPTQESYNGVSCIWSKEYVITVPLGL